MIKKLYDKCIAWAGYKYAKQILAIEAFIESYKPWMQHPVTLH